MRKVLFAIAAISGLISVGSMAAPYISIDGLNVGPAPAGPVAPVIVPSEADKTAVSAVTAVLSGHPTEARNMANYFADFAALVQKKPDLFKTASGLREHHSKATELYPDLAPVAAPGLSAAIDGALKAMLGMEDQTIDPARSTAALNALSWACLEAK